MPFSARSSTTVASMASVSTGGGRCFHVNQPYTAAATMPECSSTDSAIARQRPLRRMTYASSAASLLSGPASVPEAA